MTKAQKNEIAVWASKVAEQTVNFGRAIDPNRKLLTGTAQDLGMIKTIAKRIQHELQSRAGK